MDGIARRAKLARSRLALVLEARPQQTALLDAALRGGVDLVRLHDEGQADAELVRAAEPVRRACDAHGALLLLDGRPDLVERTGADGAHVGPAGPSPADARRTVGAHRIVGVSLTTGAAPDDAADYACVGPIHGEAGPGAGGLELVRAARDALRPPWFACGGVDTETVAEVVLHGAPGVAVGRAIRDAGDPEAAARMLREALPPAAAIVTRDAALVPQIDFLLGTRSPTQPPVAPHAHAAHTDVFFLLEGTLEFRVGDGTVRVPAGTCVAAPRLLVHGFRNPGDEDARFLNLHVPGVWARGARAGLPRHEHDQFGPRRASAAARPIVSAPGDGDRLTKPHRLAVVKAQTPDVAVLEYFVDGDYDGAPAHVHLRHTDCFHVLEGALEFRLDGERVSAEAGTSIVVPPGVVHGFTSAGRARFLNVHAPPCGFVEYLQRRDAGEEFDTTAYDVYPLASP